MIEIRLLEQLVAFADTGTLSAAAEQLMTSQPALSRSMKTLEAELGVPLFIRGKNRLTLNETGKIAAESARRVLHDDEEFVHRVRAYDRSLHTISIGFCAPVPQRVLTPILNDTFTGMTVSADMKDDADFLNRLKDNRYQLAVTHLPPEDTKTYYYKKCGEETLLMSLSPSDPLTFYPEIHLADLDGRTILLLSGIGFWMNHVHKEMTQVRYLMQYQLDTLRELAKGSEFPSFSSDYFIRRGQNVPGKINVPIADDACHTEYFLVCLTKNKKRFAPLFDRVDDKTVY